MAAEEELVTICEFVQGLFHPIADRQLLLNAYEERKSTAAVLDQFWELGEEQFRKRYASGLNQWDEGQFGADREGGVAEEPSQSFNIVVEDDRGVIDGVRPNAPSPPPSRARSPLSRVTDLATDSSISAPRSKFEEDHDLNAAIAASLLGHDVANSQLHEKEESGVMLAGSSSSKPVFGPANRSDYDPNQWAMTVMNRPTEPGPSHRKRLAGAPAFLMSRDKSWPTSTLGPLLTVLHEIPLSRNTLVFAGVQAADYGTNREWWKGGSIGTAKNDGITAWTEKGRTTGVDFMEELHRLMAFLDASDRSYATADNLIQARDGIHDGWNNLPPEELVLRILETLEDKDNANFNLEAFVHMDESRAYKNEVVVSSESDTQQDALPTIRLDYVETEEPRLFIPLNLTADAATSGRVRNLYDALSIRFWTDLVDDPSKLSDTDILMSVLTQLPDILLLRIGGDGIKASFEIPEQLYFDRFHAENEQAAFKLSRQIRKINFSIETARKTAESIQRCSVSPTPIPEADSMDVQPTSETISQPEEHSWPQGDAKYFKKTRIELSKDIIKLQQRDMFLVKANAFWRQVQSGNWNHRSGLQNTRENIEAINEDEHLTVEEGKLIKHCQATIKLHENVITRIERQLQELEAQIQACQQLLQIVTTRMTVPSEADDWHPKYKYSLRGVCLGPSHVFLCRGEEADLIELDGPSTPRDEWWELCYDDTMDEPITVKKTTLEAALRASTQLDAKPMLVYATDKALAEERLVLPDPLINFVKADNRLFKQEILEDNTSSPRAAKRPMGSPPASPSKRQQRASRASSIDSMDTNRASVGDQLSDRDDDMPDLLPAYETSGYDFSSRGGEFMVQEDEGYSESVTIGRESSHETSLGSEMVQLNISQAGTLQPDNAKPDANDEVVASWDHPDPSDARARASRETDKGAGVEPRQT